jgi:hypothetical protein
MYMGHAGDLVLYKHRDTRRYLNIDAVTGRFYRYANGTILRSGIIVNLSLATNESFKDGRGDWQERLEWHNLVAFQRTAEIIRD